MFSNGTIEEKKTLVNPEMHVNVKRNEIKCIINMKSTILVTPTTNIKHRSVIDNEKIKKRTYDSYRDALVFRSIITNKTRKSNLMDVSLYDDVIVEGNSEFKILSMCSK